MSEREEGQPLVCIYTSADGTSRLVDGCVPLLAGERGLWSESRGAKSWMVAKGHAAGAKDWHRGSTAGLSIVISGAWEIEAGDGQKRRLGTGSILAVLDTTGQGHRSRVLGDEPCVVLGVALEGEVADLLKTFAGIEVTPGPAAASI